MTEQSIADALNDAASIRIEDLASRLRFCVIDDLLHVDIDDPLLICLMSAFFEVDDDGWLAWDRITVDGEKWQIQQLSASARGLEVILERAV